MRLEGLEAALLARGPGSTAGASAGASAGPSGSASPAASPEPRRGRPHAESALPAAPLQAYTQSHALAVLGVFRAHMPGHFSTALAMHGMVEGSCMPRVKEKCMQTSAGRPCRRHSSAPRRARRCCVRPSAPLPSLAWTTAVALPVPSRAAHESSKLRGCPDRLRPRRQQRRRRRRRQRRRLSACQRRQNRSKCLRIARSLKRFRPSRHMAFRCCLRTQAYSCLSHLQTVWVTACHLVLQHAQRINTEAQVIALELAGKRHVEFERTVCQPSDRGSS